MKRVHFPFGSQFPHQFMGVFGGAIRWYQSESFTDSENVRIHRKNLVSAREGEGNRCGLDPDAFVLTQQLYCLLRLHITDKFQF